MPYHQLTKYQRNELAALRRAGLSMRQTAHVIGVHHSTVSRELRRHPTTNPSGYDARRARTALRAKRLNANQSKRKLPTNASLVIAITVRLERNDSPEQIAGWMKEKGLAVRVCAQTIYDWLYLNIRHLLKHLHCRKGKYRRTREASLRKTFRTKLKEARSIDARPAYIAKRTRYGHWEGDTVVGTAQSGSIATFVERKSGYLMAVLLPDKGAKSFELAAKQCFASIPGKYAKTLTLDNGVEMSNYEVIEKHTRLSIYFAHPYHSWERGTNENTNGLLRFYFPKKMSFSSLTQEQLDSAVQELSPRPRKRLGYKTPSQVLKVSGAIRIGV
jgi:transposase, IS30 family